MTSPTPPLPSPATRPRVLVLTPMKDATRYLESWAAMLERLSWPKDRLAIGVLESDSRDGTWDTLASMRPRLEASARRVTLAKRDFGFALPPGVPRWAPGLQLARRAALARSRNHLLFSALRDDDYVLWLDVDIVDYPADVLERLVAADRPIIQAHCVLEPGGPTFDRNAWADQGRVQIEDLRGRPSPVRIDSVGGCMLLVRADLHRDGLVFPAFRYGLRNEAIRDPHPVWGAGEIETEGLAMMARDMGQQCWCLPDLEVIHARA